LRLFGCRKTVHFPGEIKGALQLFQVCHNAEAALGVGMVERICFLCGYRNSARLPPVASSSTASAASAGR
jgi:hypothetical protein